MTKSIICANCWSIDFQILIIVGNYGGLLNCRGLRIKWPFYWEIHQRKARSSVWTIGTISIEEKMNPSGIIAVKANNVDSVFMVALSHCPLELAIQIQFANNRHWDEPHLIPLNDSVWSPSKSTQPSQLETLSDRLRGFCYETVIITSPPSTSEGSFS